MDSHTRIRVPVTSINPNTTSVRMSIKMLVGVIASVAMAVIAIVGAYYGLASKAEVKEVGKICAQDVKEQKAKQDEIARLQTLQENTIADNQRRVAAVEKTLEEVTADTDYIKVRIDFLTEHAVAERAAFKAEGSEKKKQAARKAAFIFKKRQKDAPDDPIKPLEGL